MAVRVAKGRFTTLIVDVSPPVAAVADGRPTGDFSRIVRLLIGPLDGVSRRFQLVVVARWQHRSTSTVIGTGCCVSKECVLFAF